MKSVFLTAASCFCNETRNGASRVFYEVYDKDERRQRWDGAQLAAYTKMSAISRRIPHPSYVADGAHEGFLAQGQFPNFPSFSRLVFYNCAEYDIALATAKRWMPWDRARDGPNELGWVKIASDTK